MLKGPVVCEHAKFCKDFSFVIISLYYNAIFSSPFLIGFYLLIKVFHVDFHHIYYEVKGDGL